jgi:hypothetical protein
MDNERDLNELDKKLDRLIDKVDHLQTLLGNYALETATSLSLLHRRLSGIQDKAEDLESRIRHLENPIVMNGSH